MEEYGMDDFKKMLVLSLNDSLLIRSTRRGGLMKDPMLREVRREGMRHSQFSTSA